MLARISVAVILTYSERCSELMASLEVSNWVQKYWIWETGTPGDCEGGRHSLHLQRCSLKTGCTEILTRMPRVTARLGQLV